MIIYLLMRIAMVLWQSDASGAVKLFLTSVYERCFRGRGTNWRPLRTRSLSLRVLRATLVKTHAHANTRSQKQRSILVC